MRYYRDGKSVPLSYDVEGHLAGYDDGVTSAEYVYDALGRKTQDTVTYPGNMTKTFISTYYSNGLKKTMTMPDGTTYAYRYGSSNELRSISIPGQGEIALSDYQWNRPKTILYPGGGTRDYEYDGLMRLKQLTANDPGGNPLLDYRYEYDPAGNIERKTTEHGEYVYDYDTASRLTSAENPTLRPGSGQALEDEAYTYDAVGNRLTASNATGTIEHNTNNELRIYGDLRDDYDANGNLTEMTLDTQRVFRYVYNTENRLVKVEGGNSNTIAEYDYDPFGRRLWKDVAGTRTYFFYSDEGLIAEYDASGNELRSYGYQPDSTWTTDPLWLKQDGEYYFYQNDHLGTPQKLVATNGKVVWSAQYTAFGEADVQVETIVNNLRFPGQYYDVETGLHYNWNRYYDPVIGRYTQVDPIGFAGGDVNFYGYGEANPLKFSDVLGLESYPQWLEKRLQKDFALLIEKYSNLFCSVSECCDLLKIAALKFIADEYETREKWFGIRGMLDVIQDRVIASDIIPIPGTQTLLYDLIDPRWKRGRVDQKIFMRFHPAYNDVGPANIEIKTYLEQMEKNPGTISSEEYHRIAQALLSDEVTAMLAFTMTIDAMIDLKGHMDSCCYQRASAELLVSYLRQGQETFWTRVQQQSGEMYRYLMTPEQFEKWKIFPQDPTLPEFVKDFVKPLDPGKLDDDRFSFLETFIR